MTCRCGREKERSHDVNPGIGVTRESPTGYLQGEGQSLNERAQTSWGLQRESRGGEES